MKTSSAFKRTKSRVALLATLGDLHSELTVYNLDSLRNIVTEAAPDLMCVEITRTQWENDDLSRAALELRCALEPAAGLTETVLVPIAPSPERFEDFAAPPGWRRGLVHVFARWLRWGQHKADKPEAIHGKLFESFCHTVCLMTEMAWSANERASWNLQNLALTEAIVEVVRRDPNRRILAVVQCQRFHKIEPLLKKYKHEIELVDYREL